MTNLVKRYNGIEQAPKGVYVLFKDFERLQAENEQLWTQNRTERNIARKACERQELLEKVVEAAEDYVENYGNGSKGDYERKKLLESALAALKEQI